MIAVFRNCYLADPIACLIGTAFSTYFMLGYNMRYFVYRPSLDGNEKKYVNECLDSTWISSKGRFVDDFSDSFAKYIGAKHGIPVCNGTVAIHLALETVGIGHGDEVIVPSFTYVASVNPIVQVGATPIFVDSLKDSWQMSPLDIEAKITSSTKAIIVVHLYGHPCDMNPIIEIAEKHNLLIIEDCAESIGTKYNGKKVGAFGHIATFSFFGNKTITCGEGGMVVTNDDELAERASRLKGQGLSKGKEYWHDIIGYNYRMTNIQAAIGLAQLEQINTFIDAKQSIAQWYMQCLSGLPISFHSPIGNVFHTYWMVSILVENPGVRNKLRNFLKDKGVETRPTFSPVHTMPMYSNAKAHCPIADDLSERGINLPSYPALTKNDVGIICNIIRDFYE